MNHTFKQPRDGKVLVDLVGAGGTGSHLFAALCDVALTLPKISHMQLQVRVWDPDTVSEANLGRQRFYPSDVGQNKAEILVHRANAFLGLDFEARAEPLSTKYGDTTSSSRIVIGCVDTAASRRDIHKYISNHSYLPYWLDCGNQQSTGQVILGQPIPDPVRCDFYGRLPTVLELFPALQNPKLKEDNQPSCSVAEAIAKQDLFVNRAVASAAGEMLWTLLRHGEIGYCGRFLNSRLGVSTKLRIDPAEWKRFGHRGKRKPPLRTPKAVAVAQPLRRVLATPAHP